MNCAQVGWSKVQPTKTHQIKIIVYLSLTLMLTSLPSFSWSIHDLWSTADQQGQMLMNQRQFTKAKETFNRPDWIGAAAYRAGDFQKAAHYFAAENSEQGYYNQGNALAHLGQYEQAIKAYDKALSFNPKNQDALYNRKLVSDLLKKQEQEQEQQQKQQQQNNQEQNNQGDSNSQNQKQNQDNQQNQQQQQNKQQEKEEENQSTENLKNQNKNEDQSQENKQDQEQQTQTQSASEQEQAKQQWLRLIPEDPGGLMREKFLRDHLRREHGINE